LSKDIFFAGGGTGGHIYPGIAIAEKIKQLCPDAGVHFFCSGRAIDELILSETNFGYTRLPATGFSFRPLKLLRFVKNYLRSRKKASVLLAGSSQAVVVGVGGFVAGPVCQAGFRRDLPVYLLSVDSVPGKASRLIGGWADEIFVQFGRSADYFKGQSEKVTVTGCPLREGFERPQPDDARSHLGLQRDKKVLLVTGASSGSESINQAFCMLLSRLNRFSDSWQIVHLAGLGREQAVAGCYKDAKTAHRVLGYYQQMADLLSASELVVCRAGAVSVAELMVVGVPAICIPYPHHGDRHQYLNAAELVDRGVAVVVDDLPDADERAERLWEELGVLMADEQKLADMRQNYRLFDRRDAAAEIAKKILSAGRHGDRR